MYKPKHFIIEELVSQDLFKTWPEYDLWLMFDENLLRAIDWVKETFSPDEPVTINNWKWGGSRQYSGIRRPGDPHYSPTSMHSVGKAVDMVFKNRTAEDIRRAISMGAITNIPYITRIEDDVSWLHIDTKPTGLDRVYFFKP